MRKKIVLSILFSCLMINLCACGKENDDKNNSAQTTQATNATETEAPVTDEIRYMRQYYNAISSEFDRCYNQNSDMSYMEIEEAYITYNHTSVEGKGSLQSWRIKAKTNVLGTSQVQYFRWTTAGIKECSEEDFYNNSIYYGTLINENWGEAFELYPGIWQYKNKTQWSYFKLNLEDFSQQGYKLKYESNYN